MVKWWLCCAGSSAEFRAQDSNVPDASHPGEEGGLGLKNSFGYNQSKQFNKLINKNIKKT